MGGGVDPEVKEAILKLLDEATEAGEYSEILIKLDQGKVFYIEHNRRYKPMGLVREFKSRKKLVIRTVGPAHQEAPAPAPAPEPPVPSPIDQGSPKA
jgi:O-acetyl-ADP-ribose deacetylase (regulator of RNase III)